MDRSYRRAEAINVYATQADKERGTRQCQVRKVAYSRDGLDYYEFEGRVYPGYFDDVDTRADGCIVLKRADARA